MSILGNRVLRKEDGRFLRGEASYIENLRREGALTVTFVRSLFAHARIAGIDAGDVVVSGRLTSQRMAPCPLEPRSAAAEVGEDGRITAWLCTQTPHQDRLGLSRVLGLEPEQIRVLAPDVGGGFGAKMLAVEE